MIQDVIRGVVSQLPGYEPRPQQVEMATFIADSLSEGRHAIIEAGTGSGKSFGYLIPILESGKKAVISTGTIALQEQLLNKDLPFLQQAYKKELKVAIAKGRSNYVCLRKLQEAEQSIIPLDPKFAQVQELLSLRSAHEWQSGDRADLPFLIDRRLWAEELASDHEDCLGSRCPNFHFTPHRAARIACDDADLVIANHALYFTDLITGAGVLPRHDVVVFDEAHHLERAASGALSVTIGRWSDTKLLQRVRRRFRDLPLHVVENVNDAEAKLIDYIYRRGRGQFPLGHDPTLAELAANVAREVRQVTQWIRRADLQQMTLLEDDSDEQEKQRAEIQREQLMASADGLAQRWQHFAQIDSGGDRANWMQVDPGGDYYELCSAPLDVGESLGRLLWSKRTCVLTSATLAVDGRFEFIKHELGIEEANELALGSPFDFRNQVSLFLPGNLPAPNDARFLEAAVPTIERILHVSQGRAFVLFTSYNALRYVAEALMHRLPYPCKTQEEMPRARLIEWFKTTPHSVLFATSTFWEGVDIPGDALSCVIIDKLPFANPSDPVVQARTDRMKAKGEDWFNEYMLPKAVIALKQGFGRLIRTRTDTGIVAILDRRLTTMRYGQVILRSLPPARRVHALPATGAPCFSVSRP